MFLSHTLYINVISSISSPYHDQLFHYMSSDIFFTILLYPPIEDIWPQYIVLSSFFSYPSGSGCFYMEGILIYPEGEDKELQGLSRKFQEVWLEWLWTNSYSCPNCIWGGSRSIPKDKSTSEPETIKSMPTQTTNKSLPDTHHIDIHKNPSFN